MGLGVNPYVAFRGNCREALDFYKKALGAEELYSQTYGDSPMAEMGNADAIMHATLQIGGSNIMFCDDFHSPNFTTGGNISLAIGLNFSNCAFAFVFFSRAAVSSGGTTTSPLAVAGFFGTLIPFSFNSIA